MPRLSIQTKLLLATAAIIVLLSIYSAVSILSANAVRLSMVELSRASDEKSEIQDLQLQIANIWQFLTDAGLTQNQDSIDKDGQAALAAATKDLDELIKVEPDKNQQDDMAKLATSLKVFWDTGVRLKELYAQSKAAGDEVMKDFD